MLMNIHEPLQGKSSQEDPCRATARIHAWHFHCETTQALSPFREKTQTLRIWRVSTKMGASLTRYMKPDTNSHWLKQDKQSWPEVQWYSTCATASPPAFTSTSTTSFLETWKDWHCATKEVRTSRWFPSKCRIELTMSFGAPLAPTKYGEFWKQRTSCKFCSWTRMTSERMLRSNAWLQLIMLFPNRFTMRCFRSWVKQLMRVWWRDKNSCKCNAMWHFGTQ